jgi:hypothetical protein
MPIEVGIWRLNGKPERLAMEAMDKESSLERAIEHDLSILMPQLLLVGRQVPTAFGKVIDLLAMDVEGNLVVIELKKDRTPREVVAQVIDYASWVQGLSHKDISEIYADRNGGAPLEKAFADTFGESGLPEKLNQTHRLIVVASALDASTERIINYLADTYGVPINAVFFGFFKDNGREYLARTWLIDPDEAEMKASKASARKGEPWNGRDFYVSLGDGPTRSWEDCRTYGFVSGGGGKWYSQTLDLLFPGARVFVNLPGKGYVGVGTVLEKSVPVKDFLVDVGGTSKSILEQPLQAPGIGAKKDDPELSEYLVRVKWIRDVPREQAHWEKGLFAIQHTACRLRSSFTIENIERRHRPISNKRFTWLHAACASKNPK